jgi:hypothetical protein
MLRVTFTAALISTAVGCGGLNGSYRVTPATFFLPGIGQMTPASTNAPTQAVTVAVVP